MTSRSLRHAAIGAAIAATFAVAALAPVRSALTVRSKATGELRFAAPMRDGDEFVIAYRHSVNRRPVYDTLRAEGSGLRIMTSRFDSFGAGIPETSTAENPLRTLSDGWLEYTVDRPVEDVTLFVGRVAEHTLQVRSRVIPLADLAPPGSALRFSIEKLSAFHLWRTG
jgi:hypothetical protein